MQRKNEIRHGFLRKGKFIHITPLLFHNSHPMKIKTITRNTKKYTKETKYDSTPVHRNYDPQLHPYQKQREYTRALNAVKLENVFAHPFVSALDKHSDSIWRIDLSPKNLRCFISASADGTVITWDLSLQQDLFNLNAHQGVITGLKIIPTGKHFLTCSADKQIKLWPLHFQLDSSSTESNSASNIWKPKYGLNNLDTHPTATHFTTVSSVVDIWDWTRTNPLFSYDYDMERINVVKYNPIDSHVIATCAIDKSILLYDVRTKLPIRKTILSSKSNDLCWNPQEPMNFTVGNEDGNCYTFDMRKLTSALTVHMDHTEPVLSVDYAPTGLEFCSGSYDRTIRIFGRSSGRSREVYHTKRMQRIFCVRYTLDSKYVLSGSDDTNIRIWKSNRSDNIGNLSGAQKAHRRYSQALIKKWKHMPEVNRIHRHRKIPKYLYNARTKQRIHRESSKRKEQNRRKHSQPGAVPFIAERKKPVLDPNAKT